RRSASTAGGGGDRLRRPGPRPDRCRLRRGADRRPRSLRNPSGFPPAPPDCRAEPPAAARRRRGRRRPLRAGCRGADHGPAGAPTPPAARASRLVVPPPPRRARETDPPPPQRERPPPGLRERGAPAEPDRIAPLQSALDDAQARAFAAEVRATQLEAQLQETAA